MKESYRPCNGEEGFWFEQKFCDNCKKYDEEMGCDILLAVMCHYKSEPEYPKEFIYNENNNPWCTAFEEIPGSNFYKFGESLWG